jgi:hypothetical protein
MSVSHGGNHVTWEDPVEDIAEVRALFLRQAQAENAHDIAGIDAILAPSMPDGENAPMFVARAGQFFGRPAVLQRFRDNFSGTWAFEPEEIQVTRIGDDTMHVFAPTRITVGPAGQPARTLRFLVNQIAVRTAEGWRFAVIVPVPAE